MESQKVEVPNITIKVPGCGCGFAVIGIVLLCFSSTIRGCTVDIIRAWRGNTTEGTGK